MKKIKVYTIGIVGHLFCKIVHTDEGFVMQKRGIVMLLITPIMLPIFFLFHGIYCLGEWIEFAITYKCHYIRPKDGKKNLTIKKRIAYMYYFITQY